jgi:nitrate/nitrite-specific signal transduction histidine kinase
VDTTTVLPASDTRNLSRASHRSDVDAPGLVEGLQDLVDRKFGRSPVGSKSKRHSVSRMTQPQPSFIAREAVINANKHAHAREIVIAVANSRRGIVLVLLTMASDFKTS